MMSSRGKSQSPGAAVGADLGRPCDIENETLKMLQSQPLTLTWIQFTMVLPATIVTVLCQYLVYAVLQELLAVTILPPPAAGEFLSNPSLRTFQDMLKALEQVHRERGLPILLILLAISSLLNVVTASVATAANFYTVGRIFKGQSVTFVDVLHALPELWMRLMVTGLWGYLSTHLAFICTVLFLVVSMTVLAPMSSQVSLILVCLFLFSSAVFIVVFFTNTILQVANGVSCYEESYGIPAFMKGLKLLRNNWRMAFELLSVYNIPAGMLTAVIYTGVTDILTSGTTEFEGSMPYKTVFIGVLVLISSLVSQLAIVSGALLYIHCKSNHIDRQSSKQFPADSKVSLEAQESQRILWTGTRSSDLRDQDDLIAAVDEKIEIV